MKNTQELSDFKELGKKQRYNNIEYLASIFLWQENIHPSVYFVVFTFGRLQMAAIFLWSQFCFTTDPEKRDFLTDFIQSLTGLISDSELILSQTIPASYDLKFDLALIYIIIICFLIAILLYGFKTRRNFGKVETLYCFLGSIHYDVIFWYINLLCLKALSSHEFNYEIFGVPLSNKSPVSYIINIVIYIINLTFGAVTAVFRFDPFKTENLMSCWLPSCQIVPPSVKTLTSILLICFPGRYSALVGFWVVAIIFVTVQKIALHHQFPFYHEIGMITALILNTINVIVAFSAGLITLIAGKHSVSGLSLLYIQIILIAVFLKNGMKIYERQLYSSINNLTKGAKREEDVYKTMLLINKVMEGANLLSHSEKRLQSIDELYIYPLVDIHNKTCKKEDCLCRTILGFENKPLVLSKAKTEIYHITHDLLFRLLKKSSKNLNSQRLKIYLCYLELLKSTTGSRALVTLFSIPKASTPFIVKVGLEKLILALTLNLKNLYRFNTGEYLDLYNYFDYQQLSTSILEEIDEANRLYLKFWHEMNQNHIRTSSLLAASTKFEKKADEIDRIWNKLKEGHPKYSVNFSYYYGRFLMTLRNSQSASDSLFRMHNEWRGKLKNLYQDFNLNNKTLLDPRNITVYASMKKEFLGQILETSSNVESLGYTRKELIGKNINCLVPKCLQTAHSKILSEHLSENDNDSALFREISVFVKRNQGDIMPFKIYIGISPELNDQLIYMALLRPVFSDTDFILLNEQGEIDSFTERVLKRFEITSSQGIKLHSLFENYNQILNNISFSYKQLEIYKDKFEDSTPRTYGDKTSSGEFTDRKYEMPTIFELYPKRGNFRSKERIIGRLSKIEMLQTHFYALAISYEKRTAKIGTVNNIVDKIVENEEDVEDDDLEIKTVPKSINLKDKQKTVKISVPLAEKADEVSEIQKEEKEKEKEHKSTHENLSSESFLDEEEVQKMGSAFKIDGGSSISSLSSGNSKVSQAHMERAIFHLNTSIGLNIFNILLLAFGLETLVMLIYLNFSYKDELSTFDQNIEALFYYDSSSTIMSKVFLDIFLLEIDNKGYITPNHYSQTLSNQLFLMNSLIENKENLLRNIQSSQHMENQISFHYYLKLNNNNYLVPQTLNLNEFEICWLSALSRIISFPNYNRSALTDRTIILENYFSSEQIFEKIENHLDYELNNSGDYTQRLFTILIIITVLVAVFSVVFFIYLEFGFIQDKRKLFDSLTKINSKHIEDLIREISTNSKGKLANKQIQTIGSMELKNNQKNQVKKSVAFEHDFGIFKRTFLVAFVVLTYIICFIFSRIRSQSFSSSSQMIDTYLSFLNNLFELHNTALRISTITLQFISPFDLTGISANDLGTRWSQAQAEFSMKQLELSDLMSKKNIEQDLYKIMSGNLCEIFNLPNVCKMDLEFINTGLYGYYNVLISSASLLEKMKKNDMTNSINYQEIYKSSLYLGFESTLSNLNDIHDRAVAVLSQKIKNEISNENEDINIFWLCCTIVLLIILGINKFYLLDWMKNSREGNRKLIRIIPLRLIMVNNFLKAYLRSNCQREYEHLFK